jgi:multidrug efflux pump subunit AcrB
MEEEPDLTPAQATKKAMGQITAPIIAISLVLLSVFVPIGFIPGISGTLFRQFAVTISVAMLISAVNALTLSPALCAVLLSHRGPKRGPMGWVLRRIDNIRDGYAAIVRRLVRVATLGVVTIMVSAAGIYLLSLRTPTGFLPEEDQGAFFISVQLPDGASVARTSEAARRIEVLLKQMPQVRNVFTVVGYSIVDGVSEPNMAFVVPTLKPFADRVGAANAAHAMIARVFAEGQQVRTAAIIPFNLPPIIGLSTTGGFEYDLEGLEGQEPAAMNSVMQGLLAAANQDQQLSRVFSTYTASNPSIYLDIDRQKTQALGLGMNDVFGGTAGVVGWRLHQQHQPIRTRLAGKYRGRGGQQKRGLVAMADLYPQQIRERCATALDRRRPCYRRAASHHPLQQLPCYPDSRRPVPGHFFRCGARRDGAGLGEDLTFRLQL